MESSTRTKMSKAAFTWRTILVLEERTSRRRSSQPWLRLLYIRQQLVTAAQDDLQEDCLITIIPTLLLKTMATTTKTNTTLDIHSILILKPSNPESKWLLKTTFSKSLKQKSAVAGKFQNANLAPNALLLTENTNCLPNSTFIKITELNNAKTSTRTCIARMATGVNSTTTLSQTLLKVKQGKVISKV